MSFTTRQTKDLDSMYAAVTTREGLIFPVAVTVEDEAGTQVAATAIQTELTVRAGASLARRSQRRTFRFRDTVTINRNYKIIQTTNGETATWWVKDVTDDKEGTLYVRCERPIAKG